MQQTNICFKSISDLIISAKRKMPPRLTISRRRWGCQSDLSCALLDNPYFGLWCACLWFARVVPALLLAFLPEELLARIFPARPTLPPLCFAICVTSPTHGCFDFPIDCSCLRKRYEIFTIQAVRMPILLFIINPVAYWAYFIDCS